MRVATLNIRTSTAPDGRNAWWLRRKATLAAIRGLEADLIGLQEVHATQLAWLTPHLHDEFEMVSRGRAREDHGERTAVLARRSRVSVDGVEARWYSETPDKPASCHWGNRLPRFALLTRVAAEGRSFTFVSTHFDHASGESRAASADALARWLANDGVAHASVVVGDTNCAADDPILRPLLDLPMIDALAHLPGRGPQSATFHAWRGTSDGTRMDQILVGPGWEVTASLIDRARPRGRMPSDHWPVVANLAPVL